MSQLEWELLPLIPETTINKIFHGPDGEMYLTTTIGGSSLYVSYDGQTWDTLYSPEDLITNIAFLSDGRAVLAGSSIHISEDLVSWERLPAYCNRCNMQINDDVIYVLDDDVIAFSTDYGETFSEVDNPYDDNSPSSHELFFGDEYILLTSDDKGSDKYIYFLDMDLNPIEYFGLELSPRGFGVRDNDMFYFVNSRDTLVEYNPTQSETNEYSIATSLNIDDVSKMFSYEGVLLIVTPQGIFKKPKEDDITDLWIYANQGWEESNYWIYSTGSIIYNSIEEDTGMITFDMNTDEIDTIIPDVPANNIDIQVDLSGNTLALTNNDILWHLPAGNTEWQRLGYRERANFKLSIDGVLYLEESGTLYRSIDYGLNFTPLFVVESYVDDLFVSDSLIVLQDSDDLHFSYDGGISWQDLSLDSLTTYFGVEFNLIENFLWSPDRESDTSYNYLTLDFSNKQLEVDTITIPKNNEFQFPDYQIAFLNKDTFLLVEQWLIVDTQTVLITYNGGVDFNEIAIDENFMIEDIQFCDGNIWLSDKAYRRIALSDLDNLSFDIIETPATDMTDLWFSYSYCSPTGDYYLQDRSTGTFKSKPIISNIQIELDLSHSPVIIFPNPTSDDINIQLPEWINGDMTFKLMDQQGRFLTNIKSNNQDKSITRLSLEGLKTGLYFLHYSNSQLSGVQKVFIEN
mgnify:CR=1 FL=1